MSDDALLPCPHCGEKPVATIARSQVWCPTCCRCTPAMWNRRAPPIAAPAPSAMATGEARERAVLLLDGYVFIDGDRPRAVIRDWLCWWHPDKRWVQERRAYTNEGRDHALPPDQALLYGIRSGPAGRDYEATPPAAPAAVTEAMVEAVMRARRSPEDHDLIPYRKTAAPHLHDEEEREIRRDLQAALAAAASAEIR